MDITELCPFHCDCQGAVDQIAALTARAEQAEAALTRMTEFRDETERQFQEKVEEAGRECERAEQAERLAKAHEANAKAINEELVTAENEIERLRAAPMSAGCPGGSYTSQPKDEEPTVANCLAAGVCGCTLGDAIKSR